MKGATVGLVAVLLAQGAGPSVALECLTYDVRQAYWYHQERAEAYVLVQGMFSSIRRASTDGRDLGIPSPARDAEIWMARFTGFGASRRAFDQPFETDVTLVFPDYSFIGGGYDTAVEADRLTGETGLVWLEKTTKGYRLTADLCSPLIDTDGANVRRALQCLRGGYCPDR